MRSPHVSKSSSTATATTASTSTTTTVAVSGFSQPESAAGKSPQGAFVGLSTTAHTPESTRISSTYYQQDELRLLSDTSASLVNPFEALAAHQTVTLDDDDQGEFASCSLSLSNEPARSQKSSQPVDDIVPIVNEEQNPDPTDKWIMMSGDDKKPFKCGHEGCGRKYTRKESLRIHFVTHTGDSKLRCHRGECTGVVIFCNTRDLTRHVHANHTFERMFGCKLCERRFRQQYHLKYHMKHVHSIKKEKKLRKHFVIRTGNSKLRCYLGECAGIVTYPNTRALTQHMFVTHTERRFKCEICDKRFKRADHLKYHSRHLHSPEEEKQSPKPQSVSKSSSTASTSTITSGNSQPKSTAGQRLRVPFMGLSTTVRTQESTQVTPKADQQFSGLRLLADVSTSKIDSFDDEAVTTGIAGVPNLPSDQYQAEQSPAPTDTNKWIIVDKSQERPYRCGYPGCDKSYLRRNHLIGHFIKHTGTSNFKCPHPECVGNEYYRDTAQLKRHIATTHSPDKPFQCDRCNRRFGRKDRFEYHRKHVHGIEEKKKLPKRKRN